MSNRFDDVVIGAGIGGLVTACYLAKNGRKVLIVERMGKVGGYCSSFKHQDFIFDSCVHSLESFRSGGYLSRLFEDLDIDKSIVTRNNPINRFINSRHQINIWDNVERTIYELEELFPNEKNNIRKLIGFIVEEKKMNSFYLKYHAITYRDLIQSFISDEGAREIFKMFLGCLFEQSSSVSAFTGVLSIREYVFDGGYYISGGVQSFPDKLLAVFNSYGGTFLSNIAVKKILLEGGRAKGVIANNEEYLAKNVVVSCDLSEALELFIGDDKLAKISSNLEFSKSALIVYLVLNKKFLQGDSFHYCDANFKVDEIFANKSDPNKAVCYFIGSSPTNYNNLGGVNCQTLVLMSGMPYVSEDFWNDDNVDEIVSALLKKAEKVIGDFQKNIIFKAIATPLILEKFTKNHMGAFRGWAPIAKQDRIRLFLDDSLDNLFFSGHWSPQFGRGGLPMVVASGKSVAEKIIG